MLEVVFKCILRIFQKHSQTIAEKMDLKTKIGEEPKTAEKPKTAEDSKRGGSKNECVHIGLSLI